MNRNPSTPIKLANPCPHCGYIKGNAIKLYKNRYAVKCGQCDCYQYSLSNLEQGVAS